ncbi:MAG: hypothetical protein LBU67_06710 [Oscillospiraceae bacterium]|jgi:hypothetical protein|nr:hypothetical protein [Oscillospiraceae bacterium]
MKKRLFACLLLLCLLPGAALAAAAPGLTPAPRATQVPPPGVDTPPPEDYLGPTRPPEGWVQAGPVGFNGKDLAPQQREDLIHQLQILTMREAIAQYTLIDGMATTRENPCYIGQRAQFIQQHAGDPDFRVNMTVLDTVRGEEAARLVKEMNVYNEPPLPGKEYVVTNFEISIASDNPNAVLVFTTYDFEPVTYGGEVLPFAFITDDLGMISLYSGASGVLRVTAIADERQPLLLCYRESVWFSLLTEWP